MPKICKKNKQKNNRIGEFYQLKLSKTKFTPAVATMSEIRGPQRVNVIILVKINKIKYSHLLKKTDQTKH